ncbi:MAG: hypothetical protein LQ339_002250 [Xanthoria mediterranea]|nr:MAG: hypothetical protein LQ339_002250 [Xanthoria mediterranea]
MFRLFFLLLPLLLQKADAQLKQCYKYGGNSSPDFPCNPEAETSACCGQGYICRTNLYCEDSNDGAKYAGTCTDSNWDLNNDPACPFVLNKVYDPDIGDFDYDLNTTRCRDTSPQTLCPNNYSSTSNNTCCDKSQGIIEINYQNIKPLPKARADLSSIHPRSVSLTGTCSSITDLISSAYYALAGYTIPTDGIYKPAITSSTSTSSTSATATTRTTTSAATGTTTSAATSPSAVSSSDPSPSSGLSAGAKAGIGVGIAVGVLAVAGTTTAIFLFMRRRREPQNGTEQSTMSSDPQYNGIPQELGPGHEQTTGCYRTVELPHEHVRVELDSNKRIEMPGR